MGFGGVGGGERAAGCCWVVVGGWGVVSEEVAEGFFFLFGLRGVAEFVFVVIVIAFDGIGVFDTALFPCRTACFCGGTALRLMVDDWGAAIL